MSGHKVKKTNCLLYSVVWGLGFMFIQYCDRGQSGIYKMFSVINIILYI